MVRRSNEEHGCSISKAAVCAHASAVHLERAWYLLMPDHVNVPCTFTFPPHFDQGLLLTVTLTIEMKPQTAAPFGSAPSFFSLSEILDSNLDRRARKKHYYTLFF